MDSTVAERPSDWTVRPWVVTAWLAAALATPLLLYLRFPSQIIDDAFIFFRYAENLAKGNGLVFNPGERVEGYSSPLFQWLLALGAVLGIAPPMSAWAISAAACSGLVGLVYYTALRFDGPTFRGHVNGLLAASLLAVSPQLIRYAGYRMESTLNALVMTAAWVSLFSTSKWKPVLLFLGCLGRPENMFLCPALYALSLVLMRPMRTAREGANAGILGGLIVLFFALRIVYYGDWLPNTVYAKSSPLAEMVRAAIRSEVAPLKEALRTVWDTLIGQIGLVGGLPVVGLSMVGFVAIRGAGARWLIAAYLAAYGVLVFSSGGDWMPYYRFLMPTLPVLTYLAASGLSACTGAMGSRWFPGTAGRRVTLAAAALLLAYAALTAWMRLQRTQPGERNAIALIQEHSDLYARLNGLLPTHGPILTDIIGHIGYAFLAHPIFDTAGLVHRFIARDGSLGGTPMGKYGMFVLFDRRPDFHLTHYEPSVGYLMWSRNPAAVDGYVYFYKAMRVPGQFVYLGVKRSILTQPLTEALHAYGFIEYRHRLDNGSFESGTLAGWDTDGGFQPVPFAPAPGATSVDGVRWDGRWVAADRPEVDRARMTRSLPAWGMFLSFLVFVSDHRASVVVLADGEPIYDTATLPAQAVRRVLVPLEQHRNQQLTIVVSKSRRESRIVVDDFVIFGRGADEP